MSRLSKENAELREELAEHSEDHHITEVITSLEKRTLSKEIPELNISLLSFFRVVARALTMEIDTTAVFKTFKSAITSNMNPFVLNGNLEPFEQPDILKEAVSEWLKDLVLFDLVTSRTEVIQEDTENRAIKLLLGDRQYKWWQLTSFGKKTFVNMYITQELDS